MADEQEKILQLLLKFVVDKGGLDTAKAALADIEKSAEKTQVKLKKLPSSLDDAGKSAEKTAGKLDTVFGKFDKLGRVGMGLYGIGRTLADSNAKAIDGLEKDAEKLQDKIKTGLEKGLDVTSLRAELKGINADLKEAQGQLSYNLGIFMQQIGGAADATSDIAQIIETMISLKKGGTAAGAARSLGGLATAGRVGGGGLGGGVGAALGTLAAVAGGVVAGNAGYEAIKPKGAASSGTIWSQLGAMSAGGLAGIGAGAGALGLGAFEFATTGKTGIDPLREANKAANKVFLDTAKGLGLIEEPGKKAVAALKEIAKATAAVNPSDVLGIAIQRAAGQTGGVSLPTGGGITLGGAGGQRAAILRKNAMKAEQEEEKQLKDFQTSRNRIIRDARDEERRAERDYQRERKQSVQRFNLETKQNERGHQIDMQRMQQDNNRALTRFAQARDAVGYLQQFEAGRTEEQRAEQDFTTQQKQRQDNFNLQLSQEKQDFDATQAQRRQAASRQLDDLKASLSQETEIKKQGYNQALGHARDFASQMQGIFSGMGGGRSSIDRAVDRRISQTIGRR